MTDIFVVMMGEEYSHADPLEAFHKIEDATELADKIATDKKLTRGLYNNNEMFWGDGLIYVEITKIKLS